MDWSLFCCATKGHVTYAPDEPELRARLTAPTAGGPAWRCLRCGAFVTDGEHGSGPADEAPLLRRGKELRSALILRVFAVERFLRFLVLGAAAYGVWRFKYDRSGIQRAFNNDLPAIRDLYRDMGFNVNNSHLLGLIRESFTLAARSSPSCPSRWPCTPSSSWWNASGSGWASGGASTSPWWRRRSSFRTRSTT